MAHQVQQHREQDALPILWKLQITGKSQLRDLRQSRGDEEWVESEKSAKNKNCELRKSIDQIFGGQDFLRNLSGVLHDLGVVEKDNSRRWSKIPDAMQQGLQR